MNDLDLKALWQSAKPSPTFQVDLETVKTRAARFDAQIRRRNLMEWLASILVMFLFGYDAFVADDTLEMLGNLCPLHWRRLRLRSTSISGDSSWGLQILR